MSNSNSKTLKTQTEADLGRAIDADEEHYLKDLFYFGKGCKLKAQLESEPERRRQGRVIEAVKDFLAGSKGRERKSVKIQRSQLW